MSGTHGDFEKALAADQFTLTTPFTPAYHPAYPGNTVGDP